MLPRSRCVRRSYTSAFLFAFAAICLPVVSHYGADEVKAKPGPDEVLVLLKTGNERFVAGKAEHPHADAIRLQLAGSASQADYAYATVLACSDSRVPVERIFDAGVMDIFVVRVAGNVCNTDEIGSIEYGLAHVRTPVLVILGHTQCGAVTAVTQHLQGQGHALERNIPPLVKSIEPAVKRAMDENADLKGPELVAKGIEANVWTGIENLFRASPAVRDLVARNKVKVIGAIYDVGTGRVDWLPENTVHRLLGRMEMDPTRAMDAMAHSEDTAASHGESKNLPAHRNPPAAHESKEPAPTKPATPKTDHVTPAADKNHGETKTAPVHDASQEPKPRMAGKNHAAEAQDKPATPEASPSGEKAEGHGSPAEKPDAAHGEENTAEPAAADAGAPATGGRPWGLIALCGVVFALGLGVALTAHFMRDKPEKKAAATNTAQAQTAAAANAPAKTAPEAAKVPALAPATKA
jgi:carbonic anhydrase